MADDVEGPESGAADVIEILDSVEEELEEVERTIARLDDDSS